MSLMKKEERSKFMNKKKGYGNHADVGMQGSGNNLKGSEVDYVSNPKGLTPKKSKSMKANLMPQGERSDVVGK